MEGKRSLTARKQSPEDRMKHALEMTTVLLEPIVRQTDVSLSLAKHVIAAKAKYTNFVFSPLSMHNVLGMIAIGSGDPTQDQLLGYLKSKCLTKHYMLSLTLATLLFADGGPLGGPRLSFANGVWVDRSLTLKPAFRRYVENAYRASYDLVDFQNNADEVTKEVNTWAEGETNGLVKDLLRSGSVDSTTRLIFANAFYFKGAWNEKFDASLTKDGDFFLLNGSSVRVPFMRSYEKQHYARAFDDFKVLCLPYKQGEDERKISMYFFLPDARDGLPALVEKFGSISGFIQRHLPNERVGVGDFRIPKFKINSGFEASEVFKGQGLVLSGGGLDISAIFHKSIIEVDEQGAEAASASASLSEGGCSELEKGLDFRADHPFLFVVREDISGVVFFVGQVVNPLAA